jgi:hypothetical protein
VRYEEKEEVEQGGGDALLFGEVRLHGVALVLFVFLYGICVLLFGLASVLSFVTPLLVGHGYNCSFLAFGSLI